MTLQSCKEVRLRLATPDDAHLPTFDNTKLQAINTCPVWGIIRYGHHKRMPGAGRAMPLEAGAAAHEVFAAVRLYELLKHQQLEDHFQYHGQLLFGQDRFKRMLEWLDRPDDDRTKSMNFCLEALHTSGFYDDPNDRRRTLTNIEEAMIAYMDRWPWGRDPVWVQDVDDPATRVGIEIAFDVVIEFEMDDGTLRSYRFVGKIDGVHVKKGAALIHENKTASRLDNAWRESFLMSSQVTGYCLASSLYVNEPITEAVVLGVALPQPRSYDYGGIVFEQVTRYDHHFQQWFQWFLHTVDMYEQFYNDPLNAPHYTHSCNRYFRPCAFIPICASPTDEQELILSEMEHDEWSPLHNENAGEQM